MKIYTFPSSRDPLKLYKTVLHDNGAVTCNCPAMRTCWHIKRVQENPPAYMQISRDDRHMILALLNEGNDEGAHEAVRELFPHASEEEISSVTLEIQREWDEATDEPPVFIVDEDDNEL